MPRNKRVDSERGFPGFIASIELTSDYYLFCMIYPGLGEKGYPVIQPPFFGGI